MFLIICIILYFNINENLIVTYISKILYLIAVRSRIRLVKLRYFIFIEWINPLQLHLFKLSFVILFPFYGNFVMVQRKVTVPSQSCSIRVTNTCLVEPRKRTFFQASSHKQLIIFRRYDASRC